MTCLPEDVEKTIETLLNCPERMRELGRLAQDFLKNKWSPSAVSQRFRCLIDNHIPAEWFIQPQSINYVYGVGQSLEVTRAHVTSLIRHFGLESLQLSDRPALEAACLQLSDLE
jgi:hypothetical protein